MRRLALLLVVAVAAAPAEAAPTPAAKRCAVAKKHAAKKRTKKARHAARRACAKKPAPVVVAPLPAPEAPVVVVDQPAPTPEAPVAAPVAPLETPIAAAPVPAVTLLRTLGITQREFSLSLSRTTVGSGDVTIQVNNRGEDPHDLRLESAGGTELAFWEELDPFGSATKLVALTAGTYRVFCTLPGHAAAGMDTQLTVLDG